jgi:hypothetical protein
MRKVTLSVKYFDDPEVAKTWLVSELDRELILGSFHGTIRG